MIWTNNTYATIAYNSNVHSATELEVKQYFIKHIRWNQRSGYSTICCKNMISITISNGKTYTSLGDRPYLNSVYPCCIKQKC